MAKVCIYAKESGSAQKRELKEQVDRLKEYCKEKRRGARTARRTAGWMLLLGGGVTRL